MIAQDYKLGNSQVTKIYLGSTLIWEKVTELDYVTDDLVVQWDATLYSGTGFWTDTEQSKELDSGGSLVPFNAVGKYFTTGNGASADYCMKTSTPVANAENGNGYTYEAYIRPVSNQLYDYCGIFCRDDLGGGFDRGGLFLALDTDKHFRGGHKEGSTQYEVTSTDAGIEDAETVEWIHLIVTFDNVNGILKMWANGINIATISNLPSLAIDNATNHWVGGRGAASSYVFKGDVQLVRQYSRALTDVEVAKNWRQINQRHLVKTYDLTGGLTFDTGETVTNLNGDSVSFRHFGNKYFWLQSTGYTIYRYSIVDSALGSITDDSNSFSLGNTAQDFHWTKDGKRIIYCSNGNTIRHRNTGTAYECVGFGSLTLNYFASACTESRGMRIVNDDSTLFVICNDTAKIYQEEMTTPADPSTLTDSGYSLDLSAYGLDYWKGMDISPDGTKIYATEGFDDLIHQFTLNTPFTLADGATYDGSTDNLGALVNGISFDPRAAKINTADGAGDKISQNSY